jgi:hypothetical protein
MATYTLIASTTVGAGGASSIDFTSIPATYTDLLVKFSLRTDVNGWRNIQLKLNTATTNFTIKALEGNGASASSSSDTIGYLGTAGGTNITASTFVNGELYIPNYASSNNKSYSVDNVSENNATTAYASLVAGLWSNTAAITSIGITPSAGSWVQYSTAYLYGIKNS